MLNKIAAVAVIAASLGFGTVVLADTAGVTPATGDVATMPAAGETTGTVTQVQMTNRTVTLSDGFVYDLPQGYNIDLLKNGQKVHVVWDHTGDKLIVTSLDFAS